MWLESGAVLLSLTLVACGDDTSSPADGGIPPDTGGVDASADAGSDGATRMMGPWWRTVASGEATAAAGDITTDPDGNVIVTGRMRPTADLGGGVVEVVGMSDCFVAKYDPDGNLSWLRQLSGPGTLAWGRAVTTDSEGRIYVAGEFSNGPLVFDGEELEPANSGDGFLASWAPDGTPRWIRLQAGDRIDRSTDVTTDAAGNVTIVGELTLFIWFGDVMLDGRGGGTLFVASYGADGEPRWARTMGNPSEIDQAGGVTADAAGNVYVAGAFSGVTMEEEVALISNGGPDVFIGSYTVDGFQRWVRSFGGMGGDSAGSVAVDAAGNPVFVGSLGIDSMVDFGDGSPIGGGGFSPFILSLSPAGDFRWVRGGGGEPGELNQLEEVTVGPGGRIHAAGRASRIDLGLGELIATGERDVLYARYSEAGMIEDAALFGGAADEAGLGIAVGPTGRVYILAEYDGGATDVGYGPAENPSGGGDVVFFEVP